MIICVQFIVLILVLFSFHGYVYTVKGENTQSTSVVLLVQELPTVSPPEVFGLHMNAGITRDLQNTKHFLDSLLLVHGEGGAAQGEAGESETLICELTEDILYRVSMLFKVWCVEIPDFEILYYYL